MGCGSSAGIEEGAMTGVGPSPERVQTGCWIASQEVVTYSDDNLAITGLMLVLSARTTCPSAPSLPTRQCFTTCCLVAPVPGSQVSVLDL